MSSVDILPAIENFERLDRAAIAAAGAGRWGEAERIWTEMRALSPRNRNVLFGLGRVALKRDAPKEAREHLVEAHRIASKDNAVLLALAEACRAAGDANAEASAIALALKNDPKDAAAWLAKGEVLERKRHVDARIAYSTALTIASQSPEYWPDDCREKLAHAKAFVDRHQQDLFAALSDSVDRIGADLPDADRNRWREAASIMAKVTKPFHSECHQLFVPRLPAKPFYDRTQFAWVKALEAQTAAIRDELIRALQERNEGFTPYVTLDRGGTEQQWKELNRSRRWSVFSLWQNGRRVEENIALCPQTAAALEQVDQAFIQGNCPNAMFSALAPRTHIPPHSGESNARLVVHLPLVVPENCGTLRVGYEEREWKVGEALIFDDSIEHEARNNSDELRVVLLFDVWHPQLSLRDREMVNALVGASLDSASAAAQPGRASMQSTHA